MAPRRPSQMPKLISSMLSNSPKWDRALFAGDIVHLYKLLLRPNTILQPVVESSFHLGRINYHYDLKSLSEIKVIVSSVEILQLM